MIVRSSWRPFVVGIAAFVTMVALYQSTRAPSVTFIDSGELSAVATLLGIAHPTGYPLFAMLGRLVAMVPLGSEEVVRLNVFASVLTALAVVVVYGLTLLLMSPGPKPRRSAAREESSSWTDLIVSAAGALVFGTSVTVWAQSVSIEVYALHLLLLSGVLAALLIGIREQQRQGETVARGLVLCAFLLGLSFSNHLTTVLILPGLFYLYATTLSLKKHSLTRLARLLPWFGLGMSPYLYLLVRSSSHPVLDWGHPSTIGRLLWHVSGKQYRSWIFSGFESAERQFRYFVNRLPEEYSWIALVLAVVGGAVLWRAHRRLFWFLLILFVSCIAYSINYDIHDIDSYFLLAFLVIGLAAAYGMRVVARFALDRMPGRLHMVVVFACLSLVVLQVVGHRASVDQSDNYLVEDYTRAILTSVDSNAVVLSYQWDYFVSASLYVQHVRRERLDVAVIDKELLRRSWYYEVLEQQWPWLIGRCRGAVDRFLVELRKFEGGLPYSYTAIESSFNQMINDMIAAAMVDRTVYLGPEIEPQFGVGLERVPAGLLFKLRPPGSGTGELADWDIEIRPTSYRDRLVDGLRHQCARMLVFRAYWLSQRGSFGDALDALKKASSYSPSMPEIADLRIRIEAALKVGAGGGGKR